MSEEPKTNEVELHQAVAIRDKWTLPPNASSVFLQENYLGINQLGYKDRMKILSSMSGSVLTVSAPDRALALLAAMDDPKGAIVVEANPYVTEVGVPYLMEGILLSKGDPNAFQEYLKGSDRMLGELIQIAYDRYKNKQPVKNSNMPWKLDMDLISSAIKEGMQMNQRYLGEFGWFRDPNRLSKLYQLASKDKVKGMTADLTQELSWKMAKDALEELSGAEVAVLEISNIHQKGWGGEAFVRGLQNVFDKESEKPLVFGSGTADGMGYPGRSYSDINGAYRDDPLLGEFCASETWTFGGDPNLGSSDKVPSWVSKGIWVLNPKDTKPQ